jgi:hypothetical protein
VKVQEDKTPGDGLDHVVDAGRPGGLPGFGLVRGGRLDLQARGGGRKPHVVVRLGRFYLDGVGGPAKKTLLRRGREEGRGGFGSRRLLFYYFCDGRRLGRRRLGLLLEPGVHRLFGGLGFRQRRPYIKICTFRDALQKSVCRRLSGTDVTVYVCAIRRRCQKGHEQNDCYSTTEHGGEGKN